jgi:hypothetical protein
LAFKNVKITIYRNTILPLSLDECETWCVTLPEEHRLEVFENWVLREIFGPNGYEVTGEGRKLHNEEIYDLHSPHIIQVTK